MAVGLSRGNDLRALLSLGATPGREVLIGDTAEQFSASVLGLLDNPGWDAKWVGLDICMCNRTMTGK